jgi:hypothetical protein
MRKPDVCRTKAGLTLINRSMGGLGGVFGVWGGYLGFGGGYLGGSGGQISGAGSKKHEKSTVFRIQLTPCSF